MTTIKKIPVRWDGLSDLPGYSLFYCSASTDVTTDLATYFNAIKSLFPSGLTWYIPGAGDTVDDATGAINGTWTGTSASVAATVAGQPYASGVGAFTSWNTSLVVGRRRLRGKTFLAPLYGGAYNSSGQVNISVQGALNSAAATLVAAAKLVIWHRPTKVIHTGGLSGLIVSTSTSPQVTSLRSRRY